MSEITQKQTRDNDESYVKETGLVRLTAIISTNYQTGKKVIDIVSGMPDKKVPGERWLPVHAFGNENTGIYQFEGEEYKGYSETSKAMRNHVRKNYPELV